MFTLTHLAIFCLANRALRARSVRANCSLRDSSLNAKTSFFSASLRRTLERKRAEAAMQVRRLLSGQRTHVMFQEHGISFPIFYEGNELRLVWTRLRETSIRGTDSCTYICSTFVGTLGNGVRKKRALMARRRQGGEKN